MYVRLHASDTLHLLLFAKYVCVTSMYGYMTDIGISYSYHSYIPYVAELQDCAAGCQGHFTAHFLFLLQALVWLQTNVRYAATMLHSRLHWATNSVPLQHSNFL